MNAYVTIMLEKNGQKRWQFFCSSILLIILLIIILHVLPLPQLCPFLAVTTYGIFWHSSFWNPYVPCLCSSDILPKYMTAHHCFHEEQRTQEAVFGCSSRTTLQATIFGLLSAVSQAVYPFCHFSHNRTLYHTDRGHKTRKVISIVLFACGFNPLWVTAKSRGTSAT